MMLEQLEGRRFVKVRGKRAFEAFNVKTGAFTYNWDDSEFQRHLAQGGGYGILAGYKNIIVDADTHEFAGRIQDKLPRTFTVHTPGHDGLQFHYRCKNSGKTIPLRDLTRPENDQNIGHLKAGNAYGVGPGSRHPNGRVYTAAEDVPVAEVSEEQVREVLTIFMAQQSYASQLQEACVYDSVDFPISELTRSISGLKKSGDRLQGPHPIHGSSTGTNFNVNLKTNEWFCFRCCRGGGPLQLLAVLEHVIECSESIPGMLTGELFKRVYNIALERGLVKNPKRAAPLGEQQKEPSHWLSPGNLSDYPAPDDDAIFAGLEHFFQDHIYFRQKRLYTVLATWARATWLIEKWRVAGPLDIIGPINSGKTTVLDCLEQTTYRGIRGGSMSTSVLFHLDEMYNPVFLLDESQIYNREEMAETRSVLNERYRRGGKVWRMTGEGKTMTPTSYRVFGFSARAGDIPSWPAFRSRALPINMAKKPKLVKHKKTGKLLPLKLSRTLTRRFEATGLQLRTWLNEYRNRHLSGPDKVDQRIEKRLQELEDGRTQEIAEALLASTPESKRDIVMEYLKDVEKQHQAEEETSYLAQIVQALIACEPKNGKVSARQVREQLAILWGMTDEKGNPKKGVPGPRRIMADLRTLGFLDTRLSRGEAGILLDLNLVEELKVRYSSESGSASSESSEPNMKPSNGTEHSEDSEERTEKPRSNISGEEHLRPERQTVPNRVLFGKLRHENLIVGGQGSSASEKDLCTPCWNRKYQSMATAKQLGPPWSGKCDDCNGSPSFRVRID